ncbi:YbfB/YjiJ family MFS transporter [Corynebacterium bovis]|uniref:YbfB/YjiJ family MFS transporter n=1 Tax=Corynebacterium bovis TaxID=36808 RepID=UPI000F64AB77|nr:YbfB/YjiJ family MFS transporter [Corynebacterium bovis]RRO79647.1 MFS transporter [Corynebacterium bovis]RRO83804.1 MFS transporter [Corynebacterium bovis]RRO84956.1 MFS transporter [Corynebacterium bovis]RRO92402.1 MFS transporter [Corynebacterium bovis]
MTDTTTNRHAGALTGQVTSGFAVAMGIGRFVYTPILPLMATALALQPSSTSWIAAANYVGYLLGALLLSRRPAWVTTGLLRVSLVLVVVTLAAMPWSEGVVWFCVVRLISGLASAFVFVCLSYAAIDIGRRGGNPGLAYGGVGAGICLSGLLVLILGNVGWEGTWYASAVLAAVLTVPAWALRLDSHDATSPSDDASADEDQPQDPQAERVRTRSRRALLVTYFLEGAGYIIIGTYLVAIVKEATGSSSIATCVWVVAGLAAVVSPALWRRVRLATTACTTFTAAYVIQFVSALLPLLTGNAVAAFISAALFGATFMGITQLSIGEANALRMPSAPARMTTVYGIGQILGPVIVAPFISGGYGNAFLLASVLLAACALGSLVLPARRVA